MKAVILCGGRGTRMREETEYRPKPLVQIGEKPILWHIMKLYSEYGINDFILCVGYKGDMIKQYFVEMPWRNNNFTIATGSPSSIKNHTDCNEKWNVTIVDTGLESNTGKRIKQIEEYLDDDDFMLTYGDGLSDVDVHALLKHHQKSGKMATLTGVKPVSPFGVLKTKDGIVTAFKEKPVLDDRINGGYMVLSKKVFDYIPDTNCAFEAEPLHQLATDGEIAVYTHDGFWSAIDTYKDVERANELWNTNEATWRIWK